MRFKITGALLAVVGVLLITLVLAERYDSAGIDIWNMNAKGNPNQYISEDSLFISYFGPKYGFAIIKLTSYLTNGYYGLSLAFTLPFMWTGFIGNSYSMMVVYNRFFGGDFFLESTYPFRVGEAYDWGLSKWHTAFAWYASDFTFTGTLIFFAFVAFVYGRSWRAVTRLGNPYAAPFYGYLSIGFVFVPANNQLLISPGGCLALFCFSALWLWSGGKDARRSLRQRFYSAPVCNDILPTSGAETAK